MLASKFKHFSLLGAVKRLNLFDQLDLGGFDTFRSELSQSLRLTTGCDYLLLSDVAEGESYNGDRVL